MAEVLSSSRASPPAAGPPDRFCGRCGEQAAAIDFFCTGCGQPLRNQVSRPPPEEPKGDLATLQEAIRLLATRDAAAAVTLLEDLCGRSPEWAVARAYLGSAYLATFRVSDAREELEAAVALAPESFICQLRYAEFLARLGFFDQATAHLQEALSLPAPDSESRRYASELLKACRHRSAGLFYRRIAAPKLPRLLFRRQHGKGAAADQPAAAARTI